MEKLEILRFPDSRLRKKGEVIKEITPEMVQLGRDMLETMYAFHGVGLAAIQVNKPYRLLVADTQRKFEGEPPYDKNSLKCELEQKISQPLILFNPEVVDKKGEVLFSEGCLSFPSYVAEVKRAERVTVKALDSDKKELVIVTDGLLSICLQHEIDHLDGKLFIDHLSPVKALRLKEEIKKYGYPDKDVFQSQ